MTGDNGWFDIDIRSRVDDSRLVVEVQTMSGRAAGVEFRVRLDTVEVWHHGRCAGVYRRDDLTHWLSEPYGPLVVDDVSLSLDRVVDQYGRVAISLPDVDQWTLSPGEFAELQAKVRTHEGG